MLLASPPCPKLSKSILSNVNYRQLFLTNVLVKTQFQIKSSYELAQYSQLKNILVLNALVVHTALSTAALELNLQPAQETLYGAA